MQLCSCTRVKKNEELMKFVGVLSKYVLATITWMMEPYHPCTPQNKFISDPKWIQLGKVQIGFFSIHCILAFGTLCLLLIIQTYITKLPPHALLPSYQYISVQHSHSIHFQTPKAAGKVSPKHAHKPVI